MLILSKTLKLSISKNPIVSKNIVYFSKPWFTDDQHSGFEQIYGGLLYLTVKGASHQVPQAKRAQAYDLFNATVTGHVGEKHRMEKADIIIE